MDNMEEFDMDFFDQNVDDDEELDFNLDIPENFFQ